MPSEDRGARSMTEALRRAYIGARLTPALAEGTIMRKIISLFQRNYDGDRQVRDEVVPGAEWVQAGEGIATRKWDGTCCMIRDGKFYKRYEVKPGKKPPEGFESATDVDDVTGKQQGWLLISEGPEDQWHRESTRNGIPPDGTYELIGPKIQGNAEGLASHHELVRHGTDKLENVPTDFDGIKAYLAVRPYLEGIVWHHPDGRMVKIKAKDFGMKRSPVIQP